MRSGAGAGGGGGGVSARTSSETAVFLPRAGAGVPASAWSGFARAPTQYSLSVSSQEASCAGSSSLRMSTMAKGRGWLAWRWWWCFLCGSSCWTSPMSPHRDRLWWACEWPCEWPPSMKAHAIRILGRLPGGSIVPRGGIVPARTRGGRSAQAADRGAPPGQPAGFAP